MSATVIGLAAIGVTLGLTLSGSGKRTGADAKKHHSVQRCVDSGCAVVSKVENNPGVVLYTGASCRGLQGPWFLNVVQGGPSTVPRLSYRLAWSFAPGSDRAQPSGTVSVSGGEGTTPKVTLADGTESVSGVDGGAPVDARGSLLIRLSKQASGSALVFEETGLSAVESKLHIVSPFAPGGVPLSLPVKVSTDFQGC